MMLFGTKTRAFAVASLLASAALMGPAFAQTTAPQPTTKAQAMKVAPGSPAGSPARTAARDYSTPERVEARIADLHQKLAITPAQEQQWTLLAETMRNNAKAIEGAAAERAKALQTMTVMDDLRSYETLAQTHADGLHKLVVAFEPLYTAMTPEQQKKADAEFQGYRKRVSAATQ